MGVSFMNNNNNNIDMAKLMNMVSKMDKSELEKGLMNGDMSGVMKKMNDMMKNNEIPDDIKNAFNNNGNKDGINIDMDTMIKMKSIIDNMNKGQNDPRSNLLNSLKPYLKPSRKEKVDQYIKIFNMGKAFEMMDTFGGEKKNGV